MTTEIILHKIRTLSIHFQFHFDHFLFYAAEHPEAVVSVSKSLRSVLSHIIDLVPRISNISDYIYYAYSTEQSVTDTTRMKAFLDYQPVRPRGLKSEPRERDTAVAILYVFARLLKDIFVIFRLRLTYAAMRTVTCDL